MTHSGLTREQLDQERAAYLARQAPKIAAALAKTRRKLAADGLDGVKHPWHRYKLASVPRRVCDICGRFRKHCGGCR